MDCSIGLGIFLISWFGLGALGGYLAYRGSMRDYGRNIYRPNVWIISALLGYPGFIGSMIAW